MGGSNQPKTSTRLSSNDNQSALPTTTESTSWWQLGKVVVAFTVATGAYALSKLVGNIWSSDISLTDSTDQETEKNSDVLLTLENLPNSADSIKLDLYQPNLQLENINLIEDLQDFDPLNYFDIDNIPHHYLPEIVTIATFTIMQTQIPLHLHSETLPISIANNIITYGISHPFQSSALLLSSSNVLGVDASNLQARQTGDGFIVVKDEFRVNDDVIGDQSDPDIVSTQEGDFAVAWDDDIELKIKFYDNQGNIVINEKQLNQDTSGIQDHPKLSTLGTDKLVACWDGDGGDPWDIRGQILFNNGTWIGNGILVNNYTAFDQDDCSISELQNGDFKIVWDSNDPTDTTFQDGDQDGIFQKRYSQDGQAYYTQDQQVNEITLGRQRFPDIKMIGAENHIIAWHVSDNSGYNDIIAKIYDVNDNVIVNETRLNQQQNELQDSVKIIDLFNGNFAGVWESYGQDGNGDSIVTRIFNYTAFPQTDDQVANNFIDGDQRHPTICTMPGYGYVTGWDSEFQNNGTSGVYAQQFFLNGTKFGSEIQIHSQPEFQDEPIVDCYKNKFFVVWESTRQNSTDTDIYGKLFESLLPYEPKSILSFSSASKSTNPTITNNLNTDPLTQPGLTTQNIAQFKVVSNEAIVVEVGASVQITNKNLAVEGNIDPNQIIYGVPNINGVTFVFDNGIETYEVNEFTQEDVNNGWVSLQVDGEGEICDAGLDGIPLEVDDGSGKKDAYTFVLQVETNYESCAINKASHGQIPLKLSAALLIGSIGMLAKRKESNENTNNKTDVAKKTMEKEINEEINFMPTRSHVNTMRG